MFYYTWIVNLMDVSALHILTSYIHNICVYFWLRTSLVLSFLFTRAACERKAVIFSRWIVQTVSRREFIQPERNRLNQKNTRHDSNDYVWTAHRYSEGRRRKIRPSTLGSITLAFCVQNFIDINHSLINRPPAQLHFKLARSQQKFQRDNRDAVWCCWTFRQF